MPGPLLFDAVFYGSPTVVLENNMLRYQKKYFNGKNSQYMREFLDATLQVTEDYAYEVAEAFQAKHGRTGQTARDIDIQDYHNFGGLANTFGYEVRIGDGVGFVINPLPAHDIDRKTRRELSNWFWVNSMTGERQQNFYSEFGPATTVSWYQGGPESFSPDTSWYDGEPLKDATIQAERQMRRLAQRAQLLWVLGSDTPVVIKRPWTYNS